MCADKMLCVRAHCFLWNIHFSNSFGQFFFEFELSTTPNKPKLRQNKQKFPGRFHEIPYSLSWDEKYTFLLICHFGTLTRHCHPLLRSLVCTRKISSTGTQLKTRRITQKPFQNLIFSCNRIWCTINSVCVICQPKNFVNVMSVSFAVKTFAFVNRYLLRDTSFDISTNNGTCETW